ncbi:N-acetyl-gamma-glutamyl-phosphate reductase [Roseibium sp. CAU 1637]|uniref:N-acetyl-gamma-glutamyl-phosphate reductase n=1 Tax=Roseibium limicola TaxID=2816037 RepID=A0A939JA97_9HYPH|nr:N-acetyl-gamma-glutamyl-phosphate reductase [Roseibium limicola]MBO0346719.1 N-acetyl-gamma-glutamyl-phosphate reductase [Roseibium limicola]
MTARVFIDGEAGTTGLQIRERLAARRDIELLSIREDLRKDAGARADLLNSADVAILCLPDAAAIEAVSLIESDSTRVIDASTAHRIMDGWEYGFAEMSKDQSARIAASKRVANPGCWPQGVIAVMRPLIEAGLIPADFPITVNGVSGYSGGGKSMIEAYEAEGDNANTYAPYGLGFGHKHLPEMQAYGRLATTPLFVPAVGNFAQGMLTAVPLQLSVLPTVPTGAQLHAAIADHFCGLTGSYVEVAPLQAIERSDGLNPQAHNNTNAMRLHVFANDEKAQAVLMATYDNLGKGASGAAVQNLNLMIGAEADISLVA